MGLEEYYWEKKDSSKTRYAGSYVTHDIVDKQSIIHQLQGHNVDLEFGEHTLEYAGEEMDVRLDVNNRWAAFYYDETFEEQLGEEDFQDVIIHFLTPEAWKTESALDIE